MQFVNRHQATRRRRAGMVRRGACDLLLLDWIPTGLIWSDEPGDGKSKRRPLPAAPELRDARLNTRHVGQGKRVGPTLCHIPLD